jgi:hypothetical protein
MQPPVPPLPPRSASMGVEGVVSGSGALEAMEKSVAKKSIDECEVERRWCGATDAVGLECSPSFIGASRVIDAQREMHEKRNQNLSKF